LAVEQLVSPAAKIVKKKNDIILDKYIRNSFTKLSGIRLGEQFVIQQFRSSNTNHPQLALE